LLVVALTALFYLFFMASKHDPSLSAANAFAEDPYDAVGSFGIQTAAFLAALSIVRAFLLNRGTTLTGERNAFLIRTQLLAVLAVAVTLVDDLVAMLRNLSIWMGRPEGYYLAMLLACLLTLALHVGAAVFRSVRETGSRPTAAGWKRAAAISIIAIAVLSFYPDKLPQNIPGELFTVIVGAVLLFAPMWALGAAFIPCQSETKQSEWVTQSGWSGRSKYQLAFVMLLGLMMGLFLFLAESTERSGGPTVAPPVFVGLVYVGLETTGILIGYAFLNRPVGLFRRDLWMVADQQAR
jgi:hypothetical protein